MRLLLTSAAYLATKRRAADNGGQTGNDPAPAPEGPKTLADAKTALSEALAQLATAQTAQKTAEDALAAMTTTATNAQTELATVNAQFAALTTEANQAKADLVTANATIGTLTTERDAAQGNLTKANENVSRLEALCGVKGVNAAAAIAPLADAPKCGTKVEEALEKMRTAKTFAEETAAHAEWVKACQEEKAARA